MQSPVQHMRRGRQQKSTLAAGRPAEPLRSRFWRRHTPQSMVCAHTRTRQKHRQQHRSGATQPDDNTWTGAGCSPQTQRRHGHRRSRPHWWACCLPNKTEHGGGGLGAVPRAVSSPGCGCRGGAPPSSASHPSIGWLAQQRSAGWLSTDPVDTKPPPASQQVLGCCLPACCTHSPDSGTAFRAASSRLHQRDRQPGAHCAAAPTSRHAAHDAHFVRCACHTQTHPHPRS
jgi:hypothetical protein